MEDFNKLHVNINDFSGRTSLQKFVALLEITGNVTAFYFSNLIEVIKVTTE